MRDSLLMGITNPYGPMDHGTSGNGNPHIESHLYKYSIRNLNLSTNPILNEGFVWGYNVAGKGLFNQILVGLITTKLDCQRVVT